MKNELPHKPRPIPVGTLCMIIAGHPDLKGWCCTIEAHAGPDDTFTFPGADAVKYSCLEMGADHLIKLCSEPPACFTAKNTRQHWTLWCHWGFLMPMPPDALGDWEMTREYIRDSRFLDELIEETR